MEDQPNLPVFVMVAEEAQPMPMQGATVTSIATSIHTGGAWSLVKYTAPPHYTGPPLHWHQHTMEAFYILDGTLAFTLGERTITASVGAFILVPPGIAHTFLIQPPRLRHISYGFRLGATSNISRRSRCSAASNLASLQ